MFGPNTATPVLAANRLARWSLMLSQYNYTIEYRPTKQHGNADALSRLPAGPDLSFDGEEGDNDVDTVCTIRTISSQLQPYSIGTNWRIPLTKIQSFQRWSDTYVKDTNTIPIPIVSDNATTFSSAEFHEWCHYRGIKHLTGAPYHPVTSPGRLRPETSGMVCMQKPPRTIYLWNKVDWNKIRLLASDFSESFLPEHGTRSVDRTIPCSKSSSL